TQFNQYLGLYTSELLLIKKGYSDNMYLSLVNDSSKQILTEKGDSGGPWFICDNKVTTCHLFGITSGSIKPDSLDNTITPIMVK
ncbi:MAG: hypothetical protein PHC75_10175, partial [Burkholderiales bacterium]|nr:hypothetical protein [Burkholderiales bacterium]